MITTVDVPRGQGTATAKHFSFIDEFFGSMANVQETLALAIKSEVERTGLKPEELDKICGFGQPRRKGKLPLPTYREFAKKPELLNSLVFSLASFPLGLKLDNVLPFKISDSQLKKIVSMMQKQNLGAKYACGGGDVMQVPLADQARIFILLRVLEEIDNSVTSR